MRRRIVSKVSAGLVAAADPWRCWPMLPLPSIEDRIASIRSATLVSPLPGAVTYESLVEMSRKVGELEHLCDPLDFALATYGLQLLA